jgi:2-iminobutanoate/2-iminopropanoate deaminase
MQNLDLILFEKSQTTKTPRYLLILLLAFATPSFAQNSIVEHRQNPGFESMNLPFTEAVRVDNLLFLSGQLGNKTGSFDLVSGGVVPETRQILENIKAALARNDATMSQVVKCTLFLRDIADWPAVNEVYIEYFKPPYPARSALAAGGLALGGSIEMECIAAL